MPGLFLRSALLLCLAVGSVSYGPSVFAQASDVCERALPAAEEQYRDAVYDEAMNLGTACLNQSDRSPAQAVTAYRLLALIHLKRDELNQAREAVLNLLGVDSSYTADPVTNPPSYVSLVAVVRRELTDPVQTAETAEEERPSFFRRTSTWVTMGSILVGSGVATYFTVGPGGESSGQGGGGTPPPSGPGSLPTPPGAP